MRVSLTRSISSSRARCSCLFVRTLAVYAVGEGWTGALGTGRLDESIAGHFDEEEDAHVAVQMYDQSVQSLSVGWGHTALITNDDHRLLITGRPHDFSMLLRLQRLPRWFRLYSVRKSLESTRNPDDTSFQPSALVGRFVTWLSEQFQAQEQAQWDAAREQSILPVLTEIQLPNDETPVQVVCSAGLTAVTTESGALYTFGLNGFGQCGIGTTSNNVWEPSRVTGLTTEFADAPRAEMPQTHSITSAALGLQHGLCLNSAGEIFAWGKGERGQLGQEVQMTESHTALPIRKAFTMNDNFKPNYQALGTIMQIAAGMIHSAALTDQNEVLIWGKHILPTLPSDKGKKVASDARLPYVLQGLPKNLKVERIACGSHHTAVLLEDGSVYAVGISSDTKEPMQEPVELIPPGVIEMPARQFDAHMDRTTVVGADGRVVLQVHLYKDDEMREYAAFTPAWVDRLLDELPADTRIAQVHRSWMHSVIVTE